MSYGIVIDPNWNWKFLQFLKDDHNAMHIRFAKEIMDFCMIPRRVKGIKRKKGNVNGSLVRLIIFDVLNIWCFNHQHVAAPRIHIFLLPISKDKVNRTNCRGTRFFIFLLPKLKIQKSDIIFSTIKYLMF